jgi:hypothetical protein
MKKHILLGLLFSLLLVPGISAQSKEDQKQKNRTPVVSEKVVVKGLVQTPFTITLKFCKKSTCS